MYSKKAEIDISRGELLIKKGDLCNVTGNDGVAFNLEPDSQEIAPLLDVQYNLLRAIPTAKGRITLFATPGWLDWGVDVKKGDEVYIRVIKDGTECCSTAVVRYIGAVTGDEPGTLFGVEITVS